MPQITLDLRQHVLDHLDELAYTTGATAEQIVESCIEDRYRARAHLAAAVSPWAITLAAKREYLRIVGKRENSETLAEATDVLEAAAVDAAKAEADGQRHPKKLDSGMLRYRGPKPHRLTLVVDPREQTVVYVARPLGR